ncbi:HalOD1 output domain-containing protein [Haloarcula salina]|uniref:HalOD1 output domain-containing protein n=1 Tax=Haloarcula salina TaxID=1429914 RepID=UPI003C6F8F9F
MAENDDKSGDEMHRSQVAQRHYEPDGRGELTTAIVYAIAEAEGIPPSEVKSPPLYESVNAPAIEDAFFGPTAAGRSRRGNGTVEFQYGDYLVEVRSDGWIRVYERTDQRGS